MLTSLLPPSVCASCRLCCHFVPESLWECPALESACEALLRSQGVVLQLRPEGGMTLALQAAEGDSSALCPMLDAASGCRLPRELRPLECRLWPLRLMRDEAGQVSVACYKHCPGLAFVPRETLVEHAQSLLPLFRERAASFPESIRAFHPNYVILFGLEGCASQQ